MREGFVRFDSRPGALAGVVAVDCAVGVEAGAALRLTHHRGGGTPEAVAEDTSTGTVLRARGICGGRDGGTCHPAARAADGLPRRRVTCNHFDIDGCLACYAWLAPRDAAVAAAPLLRAAARLGDFREGLTLGLALGDSDSAIAGAGAGAQASASSEAQAAADAAADERSPRVQRAALRLCCWLNAREAHLFTRPFAAHRSQQRTERKYSHFLPRLEAAMLACLEERPSATYVAAWRAEYERVARDLSALQEERERTSAPGGIGALEWCAGGLVVVRTREARHYYALFSSVESADAVLTVTPSGIELEQRYTGYVQYCSRPTHPRLELAPLVDRLNALERQAGGKVGDGAWVADAHTDSGPIMRLSSGEKLSKAQRYGQPYDRPWHASAIGSEVIVAEVKAHFAHAAANGASARPGKAWSWHTVAGLHERIERARAAGA